MAYKLVRFVVEPKQGGFLCAVTLDNDNRDANPNDDKFEEYVVPNYAKLIKAFKSEFQDFKPERKPRVKKEVV
jgi:hypothetical protein